MSSAPVEYARSPIPSVCRKPGAILGEQTSLPLFPLLLVDALGRCNAAPVFTSERSRKSHWQQSRWLSFRTEFMR